MIHSSVKPFLAIEWLEPGEGEDTAALRLLNRLPDMYGKPLFDTLLLDALYAQTPVLKLARKIGWDAVINKTYGICINRRCACLQLVTAKEN